MERVMLEWAVRESLLAYLLGQSDAEVTLTGGATLDRDTAGVPVVRLPAVDEGDAIRATGAARLHAYGGALAVDLVDVVVRDAALEIADPAADHEEAGADAPRIRLVTLEDERRGADGVRTWETRLAPEADALFLYRYLVGSPFASLRAVPSSAPGASERS